MSTVRLRIGRRRRPEREPHSIQARLARVAGAQRRALEAFEDLRAALKAVTDLDATSAQVHAFMVRRGWAPTAYDLIHRNVLPDGVTAGGQAIAFYCETADSVQDIVVLADGRWWSLEDRQLHPPFRAGS